MRDVDVRVSVAGAVDERGVPRPAEQVRAIDERVRLLPKVVAATSASTAIPTPSITDRTGTAVRPCPGSIASRNPATPAGEMPAPCAAVTSFDGRAVAGRAVGPVGRRPPRGEPDDGAEERDEQRARRNRAPSSRRRSRGATSTARTFPIGMNGDAAMARSDRDAAPASTADERAVAAATLDAAGAAPIARSTARSSCSERS